MGKRKLFKNIGRKFKKTVRKIGKGVSNIANGIGGAINNTVQNVGNKIKETRVSFSLNPFRPISISNEGGNIKRKLRLKAGYKFLLIKDPTKWRNLLVEKLYPKSSNNIVDNIYYINGLNTKIDKAEKNIGIVKSYFSKPRHTVKLIYNPTLGLVLDAIEAKKDYDWFLSTNSGKLIEDLDFNWFLSQSIISLYRRPIENPVTLATISLLFVAMAKNSPIGIIASSQGTLISFNAIIAFAKLGSTNVNFLKAKLKVCHIGTVVPKKRINFLRNLVLKYEAYSNPKDLIANVVGLTPNINLSVKHDIKYYLPNMEMAKREYDGNAEPFVMKNFFFS